MPSAISRTAISIKPGVPHRRRWFAPLVSCLFGLVPPVLASPSSLGFIYIDANVGGSSGGHAALGIGPEVYHFENDQGYTRLVREAWDRFRFVYNDLENRNLHRVEVPLAPADLERVADRLGLLLLVQNRHVEQLAALERDTEWLATLREGRRFEMRGVGFFAPGLGARAALAGLRAALERRYGPDFVLRERERLVRALMDVAYRPSPPLLDAPAPDRYPLYPPSAARRWEDDCSRWLAWRVVLESWGLRAGALIDAAPGQPLSGAERAWLVAYRERLAEAIVADIGGGTPERGFPLLLALARYLAVAESLARDQLLLLDVLPPPGRAEMSTPVEGQAGPLGALLGRLRDGWPGLRRAVFALEEPDEQAYNQLEHQASQIAAIRRGLAERQPVRYARRVEPPSGWGGVDAPRPRWESGVLARAERAARARAGRFREQLEALYPYDLVRRNCVTELVRTVDSAFASEPQARAALGGYLAPGEDWGFVPFRWFDLVRQRFRAGPVAVLPSYRNRKLGQFAALGAGWPVFAAESTTLTSSFYRIKPGDGLFLLFTEDVFWARPLYGAVNLAYGLGGAALGLVAGPFDRGGLLREGLRGALFSLPELAFANIRKGSFEGVRDQAGPDGGNP